MGSCWFTSSITSPIAINPVLPHILPCFLSWSSLVRKQNVNPLTNLPWDVSSDFNLFRDIFSRIPFQFNLCCAWKCVPWSFSFQFFLVMSKRKRILSRLNRKMSFFIVNPKTPQYGHGWDEIETKWKAWQLETKNKDSLWKAGEISKGTKQWHGLFKYISWSDYY